MARVLSRLALCIAVVYGPVLIVLIFLHFPRDFDPVSLDDGSAVGHAAEPAESFYGETYDPASTDTYIRTARLAAEALDVKGRVNAFVSHYGLNDKRVLEVGAGSGLLQDVVSDYTALDIAPGAKRFFHKPFVQGSATAMPFKDSEFDAIWTIWVLEHVPKPELALREMRRVVKHHGFIYLAPAWNCPSWAADGYDVRPYSDLDITGKIKKASVLVRKELIPAPSYLVPIRFMRLSWWMTTRRPMTLRYNRLSPNYQKYWGPDSDAINSIDSYEAYLWFLSRGDECLNCRTYALEPFPYERWPLIVYVNKTGHSGHNP